jgi:hypothetical protein
MAVMVEMVEMVEMAEMVATVVVTTSTSRDHDNDLLNVRGCVCIGRYAQPEDHVDRSWTCV